ncbi:MAG: DNA polymerase III subunit alpha [Calditrichaeota bacterium]|nr:DNA polymerase III subunit alpha [Calditrichota bacterium]
MTAFVHLHVHSYYSLLDGIPSPEQLVQRAKQLGFRHLALTDHNGLYGAVEFYRLAKEAGLHPIIGAEIRLVDGSQLLLLVRNSEGYQNLCELISLGHLRGGHLHFELQLRDVFRHKEGLFVLSGGQKGTLWQMAHSRNISAAQQYCRQMKRVFGPYFLIELQMFSKDDWLTNLRLRDLAIQHRIPLVATNDVHLLTPDDHPTRRVLHAIDQNTLLPQVTTAGSPEQYLKTAEEMHRLFAAFPDALQNTVKVARQCQFEFSLGKPIFPRIDLPAGETSFSYLKKLAFEGARERYPSMTQALIDRLNYELHIINRLGFSDYFLIVKDIVDFCHREGIPCVGRGSAGDSLVSYVLGITQVDPMRYHLYFERFLNPDRADPPDIDLDICWKNRDRVLEYVYQKYGTERTAMICTFTTFQLRSSIRDVARVYGLPEDEIGAITRYLPHYGISRLQEAIEQLPECKHLRHHSDLFRQVLEMARRIADFPRHQSIHPGGVIIAPDRITRYTPLQVAGKGIVVSQYDMYSIEPLGLVKMDLLGVRSLSIITDCLTMVRQLYQQLQGISSAPSAPVSEDNGPTVSGDLPLFRSSAPTPHPLPPRPTPPAEVYRFDVAQKCIVKEEAATYLTPHRFPFLDSRKRHLSPLDLRVIPENDPNVIALLRAGLSMGCFQTESPGMRGLLRKMQIDGVDDVITAVALIRPGAANSGMKDLYILRRAGRAPVEYPHPALKKVLEDTYGNIIYQEQVMQVAAEVAGFTLAQADILRKAMTKSRDRKTLLSMHRAFIEGAMGNGLTRQQAENIWQFLANFVGYGFNKAHSATYGTIAYQTAYLKYYFPVQYMTAVLNNQGGFYSTAAYVEECRRMGIRLLPPDVNSSERDFTARGNAIQVGLSRVYELTEKTLQRILNERQSGPYRDYYDFVRRVQPREKEVYHLIKCGALRSLEPNEPLCLLKNKLFFKHKRNRNLTETLLENVHLTPYNKYQRILNELEILDFAVTDHPLALFEEEIDWEEVTPSVDLEQARGKRVVFVGWLVTSRRVKTRNQEYMKFLTLEDRYGLCEAVLFPQTYARFGHLIKGYGPYRIVGTVQSRLPGEANLLVEQLEVVELRKADLEARLRQLPTSLPELDG